MKEFNKWCIVEEGKGRYFHSRDEYETAKAGWKAALEWVLNDLKAAREGFDLGLHDTINKELETK